MTRKYTYFRKNRVQIRKSPKGKCKTWTLDSGLDYGLDCGLTFELGIGPSHTAKGQLFNHG